MGNAIDIVVRAKDATAGAWKSVSAQAKKLGSSLKKGLTGASKFAKNAAAAVALVGAAAAAAAVKAIGAYKAQAEAEAKLEAVLKATGFAAGKTSGELKKHASALQEMTGVGDEVIISTQGIIATFKNIKGDEFDRTTMAVLDMSAVMKKAGADSAAVEAGSIALGKALNDPIKGMAQLNRVGVTFTDQQKEQVRAMQEAGDMAGAQGVILAELEGEFGGTAAAMSKANHGVDQLKASFGDSIEVIGKAIVETDGFDGIISKLTKGLQNLSEGGYIDLWAENIRTAIQSLAPVVSGVINLLGGIKTKIQEGAAFAGAIAGGSSIAEAREIAKETPGLLAKEKEERLAAIRAEKDAKAAAKEEAEKAAMAAAHEKAKVEDAAKAKLSAQKKIADAAEAAAKADAKAQADAAKLDKDRLAIKEKLAANEAKLAELAKANHGRGFEKAAAVNEKNIGEIQEKIAGVAENRADRRAQELAQRAERNDDKREKELKARVARGVKLGKDNAAFLEKRELQEKLAQQRQQKAQNLKNAEMLKDKKAEDQRHAMIAELKANNALLNQNLKAV
tara:strand:+ start:3112 stop:4803 length:1692 start_codon:yes stop_codon:yes gene_type:complete